MRCIDKLQKKITSLILIFAIALMNVGCSSEEQIMMSNYETYLYNTDIYKADFFASDLAVTADDTSEISFSISEDIYGAGLFDITDGTVYYGENLFEPLYPASTTKIVTAYVALKYGNLDDVITITEEDLDLPSDSSTCDLQVGDTLTLYDLIVGLLLRSGNDNALAIARYISGDADSFAELMNEEVAQLGATGSNFVNPHGLHDDNHYTTVYDLYLVFNECIKNQTFLDIITLTSYDTIIIEDDGIERAVTWTPTNAFATGEYTSPTNVAILGGKTGYTDNARYCLVLLEEDPDGSQYISVILGAAYKQTLYNEMAAMIAALPNT